jgi:hypothetical protein
MTSGPTNAHRIDHAAQRPGEHVIELERPGNPVGDLVDGLQLPDETAVVQIHPASFNRPFEGREQLSNIEWLLDEGERRELVRLNR